MNATEYVFGVRLDLKSAILGEFKDFNETGYLNERNIHFLETLQFKPTVRQ